MSKGHITAGDRRHWLQQMARTAILGGLAWVSWTLGGRALRAECEQDPSFCRDCRLLAACGDPPALAARRGLSSPDKQ